jgi:alcohol dehydrogenase class IV
VFPHTLAFNAPAAREKTALILEALGLGAATDEGAVLSAAHGFCERLGVEMRLSRLGVPESDLPAMADEAHAIRRLLDNNPRDASRDEILAMYRAAY